MNLNASINWRSIAYVCGFLLLALGGAMIIPALLDFCLFSGRTYMSFVASIFICCIIGGALVLANRGPERMNLRMREAFLVTSLVWVVLSIFAALPIYWGLNIPFIDACFESVSSLSTTGMSTIAFVEKTPKSILLWRSLLQWFGGMGIIVIAMTFFPALRLGGMQLFRSEFSDRYEKILPRLSQIASSLLGCYCFFTIICGILYNLAGMSYFDAACHALSTISTGGLSTHSESLSYFNSLWIESIAGVFMIIGGMTLMIFVRITHGDWRALIRDKQLHTFLSSIFLCGAVLTIWQLITHDTPLLTSVRHAFFMVISVFSTTGYINTDYSLWSPLPLTLFFIISLIGGCTGSTTGGIKIFRLQVLFTIARNHLRHLRRPNAVFMPQFQGYRITDTVAFSIMTLIILYITTVLIIALLLSACGVDFTTALTGSGAVLSTLGVGIGPIVGLGATIAQLDMLPKFILMFGMICGRLELLAVLVLFMPSFWKN
jgi:trk system potassium uptake protein TrkH